MSLFPSLSWTCVPFKFAYRGDVCVFMHEHTFSSPCDGAHVSDMCRLRDGRSERPSAGIWSWLSGLTSPWYASPTWKTCFSDITAIWNIPLDHLHLMWRQVHNKAVQVFFCLSLTQNTQTIPIQHCGTSLICIFN